jgi:hypothetical protein
MNTLIRKDKLPKQVELSDGTVGLGETEIGAWIQSCKAGRPWSSSRNEFVIPSKPPTVRRTGSAPTMPAQPESFLQLNGLKRLNIHDLKKLTGRAVVALKNADLSIFSVSQDFGAKEE